MNAEEVVASCHNPLMIAATDLDWAAMAAEGFQYPHGRPVSQLAAELTGRLTSRDPEIRDRQAYSAAAVWIRDGRFDTVLEQLGDDAAARFGHPEVQARTFAPLLLELVLTRSLQSPGLLPGDAPERWYAAFATWYPAEPDTRGWDEELGWLHAVAHGADVAPTFAEVLPRHRHAVLELCALRMTAKDTSYRFEQGEDARLARAITTILNAPPQRLEEAIGWLAIVEDAVADADIGSAPAAPWISNTFATLQCLHLHLTRGIAEGGTPHHAPAIADRVAAVLRKPYRWLA
ncbi:MAG: DUF2785 domain-containing protein [Nocardioides sp.]